MRRGPLIALAAACALSAALPARAVAPTDQASRRWKQVDGCVADANKQVPDHNEAALRKRDTLVNQCLKDHGLPPRAGLAPPEGDPPADKPAAPAGTPPS